jgi:hypothetical protein
MFGLFILRHMAQYKYATWHFKNEFNKKNHIRLVGTMSHGL